MDTNFVLAIPLAACAWASASYWFTAVQVSQDTFVVKQRRYGGKRDPGLDGYILKKCANLALEKGFTHFVVKEWRVETGTDSVSFSRSPMTGMSTMNPSSPPSFEILTIQLFRKPTPEGAYDAEWVQGQRDADLKRPAARVHGGDCARQRGRRSTSSSSTTTSSSPSR